MYQQFQPTVHKYFHTHTIRTWWSISFLSCQYITCIINSDIPTHFIIKLVYHIRHTFIYTRVRHGIVQRVKVTLPHIANVCITHSITNSISIFLTLCAPIFLYTLPVLVKIQKYDLRMLCAQYCDSDPACIELLSHVPQSRDVDVDQTQSFPCIVVEGLDAAGSLRRRRS